MIPANPPIDSPRENSPPVADRTSRLEAPEWPGPRFDPDPPPFHKAGHDFWVPHFEAALLSAVLNYPERASEFLAKLTPEKFYDQHNLALYVAALRLVNEGATPTPEAVLLTLKQVDPAPIEDWVTYVARIAAVHISPGDVEKYKSALGSAERRRGGASYCVHKFNESHYAELLRSRLPLVHCVGDQWYEFRDGCWQKTPRSTYRKLARECIHPYQRQHKRILDVLGSVESSLQVPETNFCGANKRTPSGTILINVANGVLELSPDSNTLLPHDPAHGFTLKLPTSYDPGAGCPLFESVVSTALPDPADSHLLQCFAGGVLSPDAEHEAMLVAFGQGATGKSTVAAGIKAPLGDDLCSSLDIDALCSSNNYSLPSLKYKMLNLGSELKATEVGEASLLKAIVSGESFNVREIYGKPAPMRTTVKLMWLGNHLPKFKNGTDAELRRIRILHFNNPPDVVDRSLKSRLPAEASGILNWLIEGFWKLALEKEMPHGGKNSRSLLGVFAASNDPVGRFVADCCQLHIGGEVNKKVLFAGFVEWCNANGIVTNPDDSSYFFRMLRSRFPQFRYIRRKHGGKHREGEDPEDTRMVIGIRIPKNPSPLTPQSVSEAVEMKQALMGHRAIPIELPGLRET